MIIGNSFYRCNMAIVTDQKRLRQFWLLAAQSNQLQWVPCFQWRLQNYGGEGRRSDCSKLHGPDEIICANEKTQAIVMVYCYSIETTRFINKLDGTVVQNRRYLSHWPLPPRKFRPKFSKIWILWVLGILLGMYRCL